MSRTSAVNWLKSIFTSKSAPAKGLVSIPNSRTPAANLLDSNQQEAYQAFLDAQAVQSSFQTLSAISEDNTAFINLGSEYGGLESASKEGVSFYSPIGFDRCVVATPDQGETALIAKGAGLRSASESYLFTEDIIGSVSTRDQHKPIDVNPSSEDIDLHPLIGGLGYKSSLKEVQGAAALLNLIHGLESGEELGGMILPLAVRRLKKFPIILRGKLQLIKGWNLFTNPDHMTRDQLLNVGTIVREEAKYAGKKITAKVADIFIDRVLYRKRIPRIIRWLVGRTFMKLARPSVYEYVCKTGDFRIGHLHERLVSNGGLDRTEINRELAKLYAIFKQTISLPSETNYDLRTEEGRISYLQQVFSHENNSLAATEICTQIAKETGRQLGILHGAGGHAGGHVYIHQFGEVTLTLEHKQTKKQIILKVRTNSTEQELDLHDYEISQIEAEQFGRHEFGAVGGGSTRPNNLGFGLRDLISISSSPQKSGTNKLAELFPPEVGDLFIRGALKYFYLKMVQQADLDMLFVCRMRKEVAQAGNLGDMAGSLPLLVQALGGNLQAFESAKAAFFESYQKFYSLSLNKKVRPSFFESWDSSKNRPKLIYKSPSEDGGEEEVINGMFPKSASVKRAA